MCGIAGYMTGDRDGIDAKILRRMADSLHHRGPDGSGMRIVGPVGLAHRRLSIIDLDSGQQPMANAEDGSVWITFNGEIYNYIELRRDLEARGHRFRTSSDTETILHLYEERGAECVSALRGMFAFALYDHRAEVLMLARDRFGIKPLYYYDNGHDLIFASEIKALLQHPMVNRELDPIAVSDYFTYRYVPGPRSIFRGVQKLEPATTLCVRHRHRQFTRYWQLNFATAGAASQDDPTVWQERLDDALQESVRLHMRSDVPYGALLSGGMDSSAIVALMAATSNRPIKTYALGFDEQDYSELRYAREVAQHFDTDHHEYVLKPDGLSVLPDLVRQFDEPFADPSALPCFHIAREVAKDVKVCLTGDGGDETFAGYDAYRVALGLRRLDLVPQGLRRLVLGPIAAAYPRWWLGKGRLGYLPLSFADRYAEIMSGCTPHDKRQLLTPAFTATLQGHDSYQVFQPYFEQSAQWDQLSQLQYVDFNTYLPDDIEVKIDRTSMFHSLELRVPFIDHVVLELASHMPRGLKIQHGQGKYVLRQLMQPRLPATTLTRAKTGFAAPLKPWLGGQFGQFAEEVFRDPLTQQRGILNVDGLLSLLRDDRRGRRDQSKRVWTAIVFELWCRDYLDALQCAT